MEYLMGKFEFNVIPTGVKRETNPFSYNLDYTSESTVRCMEIKKYTITASYTINFETSSFISKDRFNESDIAKQMINHMSSHIFNDVIRDLGELAYRVQCSSFCNDDIYKQINSIINKISS